MTANKKSTPKPKKKSSPQSANAAEKRATTGMNTKIPVYGYQTIGTTGSDGKGQKLSSSVGPVRIRRNQVDHMFGAGRIKPSDLKEAISIEYRGDRRPLVGKVLKGKSKSSVEVGRKQKAASGKKTARKMK